MSRANDLVYVFSNMRLFNYMTNVSKISSCKNASSSIVVSYIDSLVDDIVNEDDDDIELLSNTSVEDELDDLNDALDEE